MSKPLFQPKHKKKVNGIKKLLLEVFICISKENENGQESYQGHMIFFYRAASRTFLGLLFIQGEIRIFFSHSLIAVLKIINILKCKYFYLFVLYMRVSLEVERIYYWCVQNLLAWLHGRLCFSFIQQIRLVEKRYCSVIFVFFN